MGSFGIASSRMEGVCEGKEGQILKDMQTKLRTVEEFQAVAW